MRSICQDRTVFVIAHRLSTVRDCDRIITIEAGEVVEDGSHDGLLQTNGRYSKLWNMQAAGPRGTQPANKPEVKLNQVPLKGLQAKTEAEK
jgi:subfamily B ATP-binding cassette protein HlyB/CyaB